MPEIVIDRNKLESYEKELTPDKFRIAFAEISESQKFVLEKLIQFLKVYVAGKKYPQTAIDDQNAVFSERQVNDIKEIFKSALSLDSKTIDNYINAAVKDTSLKDTSIYNKDLKDLKDAIKLWSKSLIEKIEGLASTDTSRQTGNADSDRNGNAERDAPELPKFNILPKSEIAAFVSRNLNFPGLNFKAAKIFLDSNVFKNISYAFVSKSFSFRSPSGEKIRDSGPRKMRIWNPSIASIARPFVWFDNAIKYGIRSRVRSFAKKFKTSAFNFLNTLFPLTVITSVVKFGYKFARIAINVVSKTIGFVYTVASKLISVIVSTVGFIAKTAYRIGSFAIKFLYGSIKKVAQLKATKLLVKGALAFFKSYPGAYLLGFIVGRIYSRIKDILGFAGEIYEKIKEAFNDAKEYVEKHIYIPYIAPIVDTIVNGYKSVEDSVKFYSDLFVDLMMDSEDSPLKNLEDSLDLLTPLTGEGGSLFSLSRILRDASKRIDEIEKVFEGIDGDVIKNFAIKQGARSFGSIVGSRLGAAVGQAIIPIPVLGAVIGSLLGGWGGEKLGGWIADMITATSNMTKSQSEESDVEKYIRTNFGYLSDYAESSFSRPSAAKNVHLLQSLGKKAASRQDFDIEKSAEAKELSKKFGINIWADFQKHGGKTKNEFVEKLEMLGRIDARLSYNTILKDINASLKAMHKLLDHENTDDYPRGFLLGGYIPAEAWNTKIHLKEKSDAISLKGKFKDKIAGELLNPFWLRIGRDILILNKLRMLSANQISPFKFLKTFDADDSDGTYINEYGISSSITIPISMTDTDGSTITADVPLLDLINGSYFRKSPYGKIDFTDMALRARYGKLTNGEWASRKNLDKGLQAMTGMVAFFPLDSGWHVFSKRLMQDLGFDDTVRSSAKQYNASSLGGFSGTFNRVRTGKFGESEDAEKYGENEVAFNIIQRLGENAKDKWSGLSREAQEALIEESMNALIERKQLDYLGDQAALDAYSEQNGVYASVFRNAMSSLETVSQNQLSDNLEESFKNAFKEAAANSSDASITLDAYSKLVNEGNEFLKNQLIPALEYLVREKGANKKQLLALFNLSNDDIPADSPLAETVGDTVSPKEEG